MASLVEQKYIEEVLQEAAEHIYKDQSAAIQNSVSAKSTGFLLRNRFMNISGTNIQHVHPIYERFLDMKRLHRGNTIIKRRPLHIHNRFMWGLYLRIQERLMYGLTDNVSMRIRQSLGIEEQFQAKK